MRECRQEGEEGVEHRYSALLVMVVFERSLASLVALSVADGALSGDWVAAVGWKVAEGGLREVD